MKRKVGNLLFSLGAGILFIIAFFPLKIYFWREKNKLDYREEKYKRMQKQPQT